MLLGYPAGPTSNKHELQGLRLSYPNKRISQNGFDKFQYSER